MPQLRTIPHQRSHVPKFPPEQGEAHEPHHTYLCPMRASQLLKGWLDRTSSILPAAQPCHITIGMHLVALYHCLRVQSEHAQFCLQDTLVPELGLFSNLCKGEHSVKVMLMQMTTRAAAAEKREKKPLAKQIEEDVLQDDTELSLPEVNGLLNTLWQKREAMEKQEGQIRMQLLLQFLHHARQGASDAHVNAEHMLTPDASLSRMGQSQDALLQPIRLSCGDL